MDITPILTMDHGVLLGMWAAAPLSLVKTGMVGITTPGRGLEGPKAVH